ncbi:MAG: hypothetical protein ACSHWU_00565 [Marinicella sp.]
MNILSRGLAGVGGLLLLMTAYYHSTGLTPLQDALAKTQLPTFFVQVVPVQWMFFAWHLTALAIPLLWASARNPYWFLPAVIFCGVVVLGDFIWVYSATGWFPGTVVLLTVAVMLWIASFLSIRASSNA